MKTNLPTPEQLISNCYEYGKLDCKAYLPMITLSDLLKMELLLSKRKDWLHDLVRLRIDEINDML